MKQILTAFLFALCASLGSAQTLKVGSLHPLIGDLARQVGGDRMVIVDVLKPGSDMHHFEPTAKDVASLKGVSLVLASGKHLENYLDNLRDSLGSVPVVEVGRTIPSIRSTRTQSCSCAARPTRRAASTPTGGTARKTCSAQRV